MLYGIPGRCFSHWLAVQMHVYGGIFQLNINILFSHLDALAWKRAGSPTRIPIPTSTHPNGVGILDGVEGVIGLDMVDLGFANVPFIEDAMRRDTAAPSFLELGVS